MIEGIRAVVFDWAGTTIDFGCRAPVAALTRVFEDAGVPISEAEARADMGRAKRDHIRAILSRPRVAAAWTATYGHAPDIAASDRLHNLVEPAMREAAATCAKLIEGASELATRLRAENVGIGSCTGYTRSTMSGA